MPNTNRSIVSFPETQNDLRANKTTFRNKISSSNLYPQVQEHRLQNPQKVMLGHLNLNSERNKTK